MPALSLLCSNLAKQKNRGLQENTDIPPSQLSIRSSFCVYTFPDRRCAESALSAVCIPGEAPLLGLEASSSPLVIFNDWC